MSDLIRRKLAEGMALLRVVAMDAALHDELEQAAVKGFPCTSRPRTISLNSKCEGQMNFCWPTRIFVSLAAVTF